jgi:MarR family transcriptional regulator, lower aerobic nicotinate degradation pathway regulator
MTPQDDASIPSNIETKLSESSGFLLAMLGQESRRRFMVEVNRRELGWPHQSVLGALLTLHGAGTTSQRQLGEYVGIDPRNLVAILDVLEERQLVERVPDPADRRRSGVRLTERGAELASELRLMGDSLEREFFSSLSPAERDTLHRLLLKLYRGIEHA